VYLVVGPHGNVVNWFLTFEEAYDWVVSEGAKEWHRLRIAEVVCEHWVEDNPNEKGEDNSSGVGDTGT